MKELGQMQKSLTPQTKANCISNALQIVSSCFSLFGNGKKVEQAAADNLINIFPYVILKAKVKRLHTHLK